MSSTTLSTSAITTSALAEGFQPADYFALMVLAFVSVTALVGNSVLRGFTSLFIGVAIGLVGLDELTGQPRYTFGLSQLLDGLDVVPWPWGCSPSPR